MQCFRGNSVSIETVLLKMPLVWKNTYLHPTALYAHKYRNISVLMCLVCIWRHTRAHYFSQFYSRTHLRSIIIAQLQATYVRGSIIGLALWEKKWQIVLLIVLAVLVLILFWLCSSNHFVRIRLKGPNSPYIISLTLTVCRLQTPTHPHTYSLLHVTKTS